MIWIMLATLAVVFVIGFRVLTSGARKAIRRLSDRLNIDVVPVESMVDQMGKSAVTNFYVICIVRMSRTCKTPRRCCSSGKLSLSMVANRTCCNGIGFYKKPALPLPITDAQVRLALGFLRETEPEMQDINAFQMRYNAFFQPAEGVHWLH